MQLCRELFLVLSSGHSDRYAPAPSNGFGLAQWIRKNRQGLPVVLVSGDAQKAAVANQLCDKHDVMQKPFDFQSVAKRLRAAIEASMG
jgi:DNA-binding response OmpR family regulator